MKHKGPFCCSLKDEGEQQRSPVNFPLITRRRGASALESGPGDGALPGEEVDEEGEDDGADGGDDDADDEAVLAGAAVAEGGEEFSADDGADEADDHVEEPAEAASLHDLAGEPACHDADDDPAEDAVGHEESPEARGFVRGRRLRGEPAR